VGRRRAQPAIAEQVHLSGEFTLHGRVFVQKSGVPPALLNQRIAAFQNPEFYRRSSPGRSDTSNRGRRRAGFPAYSRSR
jgi:hypothetical protein